MYELKNKHNEVEESFYAMDLDYVEKLELLEDGYGESYERLSILTNEVMCINDVTYFRVCRIIDEERDIFDLNKLMKLTDISVWSNGSNNISFSKYIIYWKGKLISYETCPPCMEHINNEIKYFGEGFHTVEEREMFSNMNLKKMGLEIEGE